VKNVQEILAQIDHIMTEVDLELYEWQTAADMMSFIGQEIPLQLWTNDDPPIVVTLTNMENTLMSSRKPVRVMHFKDGEWGQVGTAELDVMTGVVHMSIDEDVPELRDGVLGAMSLGHQGEWKPLPSRRAIPNPPFEGLNKPLTIAGLDKIIKDVEEKERRRQNLWPDRELDNHPFFNKEK